MLRLGAEDRGTRRHNPEIKKSEEKHTLTLYQAKAIFEGASERFELTLNKNDTVKVLDKNDHGVCDSTQNVLLHM